MIRIGKHIISPTMFPDKTSQVWHLPDEVFTEDNIYWEFEHEAELIHVCQLADLLKSAKADKKITLVCPYLPYARQHKKVSNDSTFALETFCRIIEPFIDILHTFDVHDETFFEQDGKPYRCKFSFSFKNVLPTDEIDKIAQENNIDLMLFADKSAQRKYQMLTNLPSVGCNKIRDPGTGKISKFEIKESVDEGLSILVQDDLCDGGKTFIDVADVVKPFKPKQLILYISHGIFSRGTQCLFDAGYDKIYTRKGEVAQ